MYTAAGIGSLACQPYRGQKNQENVPCCGAMFPSLVPTPLPSQGQRERKYELDSPHASVTALSRFVEEEAGR